MDPAAVTKYFVRGCYTILTVQRQESHEFPLQKEGGDCCHSICLLFFIT